MNEDPARRPPPATEEGTGEERESDSPRAQAAREGGVDVPSPVKSEESEGVETEAESAGTALVTYDSLQRYLAELRRYRVLSREEEHVLAVRYKEHDDLEAAYRLVTGNLRLVVMIARQYQKATRNLLDLIQEGNIGLMEAVKNFDPYRGIRFPSYAVWWVRAYIIRYLMNNWRMVKVGTTQAQRKLFFNLRKEQERLEREGISPQPKLIAQRLDVKEAEVVEMQQRLGSHDVSMDDSGDDDGRSLFEVLPSRHGTTEGEVADAEFQKVVGEKMRQFGETLKDKEAFIFKQRLLAESPLTLREIGDRYGISRERVRQIEERVKKKLKLYLQQELKDIDEAVRDSL